VNRAAAEESDPRAFFRLLWRRKWILLACLVVFPLVTYLVSTRLAKTYEASAVVQLQGAGSDQSAPGVADLLGSPNDEKTGERAAALIETNGVADQAARLLREPVGSLRGDVQATADEDTGFITITASASTPQRAAKLANAFSDAVRVTRAGQARRRVDQATRTVREQLKRQKDDLALRQQLQGLETARAALRQNVQVIEAATPPTSAASPNPTLNALFALVAALFVGAGLVALLDRLDRRLHDPDDLERLSGAPLLVHIPPSAFPGSAVDPEVPLAFQMLRDSLMYFNVDHTIDSLIVVSALKGEGKTTVAANLAAAYARAGKRVIALDADLRSPQLGPRLGVDHAPGLSNVLVGEKSLEDALAPVGPYGENLRVLPGGVPPPNPSELLGSVRMASIFDALKADSDLVIVDTPPLLIVSDAFGLLERASGALAVARLEQTRKDAVARMAGVVETVNTRLLGIVATGGAPPGHGYGYGYGYGYGETPAAPSTVAGDGANGNGQAPKVAGGPSSGRRLARIFRSN